MEIALHNRTRDGDSVRLEQKLMGQSALMGEAPYSPTGRASRKKR